MGRERMFMKRLYPIPTNEKGLGLQKQIWLGIYFGDFKAKNNHKLWLEYGLKELEMEMFFQVNFEFVYSLCKTIKLIYI